jgi:hypothetical protein
MEINAAFSRQNRWSGGGTWLSSRPWKVNMCLAWTGAAGPRLETCNHVMAEAHYRKKQSAWEEKIDEGF